MSANRTVRAEGLVSGAQLDLVERSVVLTLRCPSRAVAGVLYVAVENALREGEFALALPRPAATVEGVARS